MFLRGGRCGKDATLFVHVGAGSEEHLDDVFALGDAGGNHERCPAAFILCDVLGADLGSKKWLKTGIPVRLDQRTTGSLA